MTFALVALGLCWRTYRYALGLPIWGDEAFVAVNFVMRDFAGMIEPLVYGQICPLFFMWAELAVTKTLGLTEWALRLLPFLSGFAGLVLFARFTREVLPRSAWLCATGIFAGSYFIVRHSTEVKPYAIDLIISLSLTLLGWSVLTHPRSVRRWIALILLSGMAVWCSYPSLFVGGSVGLLLTLQLLRVRFRPGFLIGWSLFGLVLCGMARFMYVVYAKPHAEYASRMFELESWSSTFPPVAQPWKLPVWFYEIHTGNMFAYPQGGRAPGSIATFALFLVGCVRMWRMNRDLLLLLTAPFALTFLAAAMKAYPYGGSARVAQHLAPAICMLTGLGLSALLTRFLSGIHLRRALVITTIILAVLPVASMIRSTVYPYKSTKVFRRHESVQSVVRKTQPGDRWVIFNALKRVPYAPYMGDWRGVGSKFIFDVMRFSPVPVSWAPPPESIERKPSERVWLLVYYAQRPPKVSFPKEQLDAYVGEMKKRLREPTHESYLIRDEPNVYESLEIYRFGG